MKYLKIGFQSQVDEYLRQRVQKAWLTSISHSLMETRRTQIHEILPDLREWNSFPAVRGGPPLLGRPFLKRFDLFFFMTPLQIHELDCL
jgi:hypothetical protein